MGRGRPPVPRIAVQCVQCGTEIEKRQSDLDRSKTKRFFCGPVCSGRGTKPRRGEEVHCAQCGKSFYRGPSSTQRLCSHECNDNARRKERHGFACEVCGDWKEVKVSLVGKNANRFCSRKCMAISRIKRPLDREHNGYPARLTGDGYVLIYQPDHPNAIAKGWIYEHRYVMAEHVGRALRSDEEVDHINRDRADNRLENLQLMSPHEHSAKTSADRQQDRDMADFLRSNPDLLAAFEASRLG